MKRRGEERRRIRAAGDIIVTSTSFFRKAKRGLLPIGSFNLNACRRATIRAKGREQHVLNVVVHV